MTGSIGPGSGAAAPAGPMVPVTPRVPAAPGVRRMVLLLGGAIVALAAIATLVIVLATRAPASYPAGSPEAAFQGYLTAWEARDLEEAYSFFSDRVRAEATLDDYRTMDRDFGWAREADRRVVLLQSRVTGDRATLDLRIDQFSSGGFGGGDVWSQDASVALVRENGTWHVDEYLVGLEPMSFDKW